MELFLAVIGTPQTISLFRVEKTANIVSGINMEDNYTTPHLMTTLSPVSSGLQMETILLWAPSRCYVSATELGGHTHLINLNAAQFSVSPGAMMEQ
jgi:hypothetical protein